MLVLTRKTSQQIQIGENVVITILHVRGQSVRVGIEAPRQLRVVRSEIADRPVDDAKPDATTQATLSDAHEEEVPGAEVPNARAEAPKSRVKARPGGSRPTPTGSHFSSPLADRVTAVLESSAPESRVVGPFPLRPFGGQDDGPSAYHFQVGRSSALTTHPSGQRP